MKFMLDSQELDSLFQLFVNNVDCGIEGLDRST